MILLDYLPLDFLSELSPVFLLLECSPDFFREVSPPLLKLFLRESPVLLMMDVLSPPFFPKPSTPFSFLVDADASDFLLAGGSAFLDVEGGVSLDFFEELSPPPPPPPPFFEAAGESVPVFFDALSNAFLTEGEASLVFFIELSPTFFTEGETSPTFFIELSVPIAFLAGTGELS